MRRNDVKPGLYAAREGRSEWRTVFKVEVLGEHADWDNGARGFQRRMVSGFPARILGRWNERAGEVDGLGDTAVGSMPVKWRTVPGRDFLVPAVHLISEWSAFEEHAKAASAAKRNREAEEDALDKRFISAADTLKGLGVKGGTNLHMRTFVLSISQMEALAAALGHGKVDG